MPHFATRRWAMRPMMGPGIRRGLMSRLALKLAVVAAVAGTAGMAKAADLPVKAPPPTAIVQANWNGLYVGAHVGWGRTTADGTSDFLDPSAAPPGDANPQANKLHKSSVIGGAHRSEEHTSELQ